MKTLLLSMVFLIALGAQAQSPDAPPQTPCAETPSCVLDTLWPDMGDAKPHERRGMALSFVDAARSADVRLAADWAGRLNIAPRTPRLGFEEELDETRAAPGYAGERLLLDAILNRRDGYHLARPDYLLAFWRTTPDAALKTKAREALLSGISMPSGMKWEEEAFALALTSLALETCDGDLLRQSIDAGGFEDHPRYDVLVPHVAGMAADPARLVSLHGDDFNALRAVVEGYGESWRAGACPAPIAVDDETAAFAQPPE